MALYRRLFWPILAPSLLIGIAAGATVPVQILAAMQLGASAAFAALIVAIVGGIGLLTTVPAGRLIDVFGDQRAMAIATAVVGGVTALTVGALVWGGHGALTVFVAASFLRAPAINVWSLARQAYTAEHVATHEVGRAMTALGGTFRIGALVGPLVGGLLLLWWPLWSVYVFSLVCAVLALVILDRPDPAAAKGRSTTLPADQVEAAEGRPGVVDGAAIAAEPRPDTTMGPVRWPAVILAGIAMVALAAARAGQPVVVQLWGVHVGLEASAISLIVAVGAAVEIVLMFPGGYLKDRLGRSIILVVCLVVYGSGFLLLVPLTAMFGVPGLVSAVVVMAVGNGLGAGVNMTIGADLSPSRGRGRFLGIWALFSNVGGLGAPLLISFLVAAVSVQAAVFAIGGLAVAGAIWMTAFARRIGLPGRTART